MCWLNVLIKLVEFLAERMEYHKRYLDETHVVQFILLSVAGLLDKTINRSEYVLVVTILPSYL